MDTHTDSARWWGERTLAEGERLHGRLGTLELWLERGPREWLATTRHGDDEARTPRLEQPWEGTVPEHDEQTIFAERFAFRHTGDRLQLLPAMPPRPVVVHTATPLVIPGGEEATVYISLPLWLRASAGGELLLDVPVVRQSDTWFGAITGPGELCYASRSRGRLRLEVLPATPLRARAAIHVRNSAAGALPIDGLRLPAPFLSLYADGAGQLWTESVLVDHEQEGEMAALDYGAGPPREAAGAERVAGPRNAPERRALVHTFSSLIRGGFDALRHSRSRSAGVVDH